MISLRLWGRKTLPGLVMGATLCVALATSSSAHAEKVLIKGEDFEVFVDGRAGGFFSWAYGDAYPQPHYEIDANGIPIRTYEIKGGDWGAIAERGLVQDPRLAEGQLIYEQGTVNMMRVRSGFIGNILGLGVRSPVSDSTMASAYIQLWAFAENESRQKTLPNYADVRQGYAKVEGPWGSFLAGRTRALFSRGATDINVQYAHKYGVGFPKKLDSNGPTPGQIGFGVMGSGFAAGLIYATPKLAGFQGTFGVFDPVQLTAGTWFRTKYLRPETELTYELPFSETGKFALFANGTYQRVYKDGYCAPPDDMNPLPCDETVYGMGYGGRFELGPVRLGIAGHTGQGLGLNYALENNDAAIDPQNNLRKFDGYYVQSQFVFDPIDVFAGAGIVRVFLTDADKERVPSPADPTGQTMIIPVSVIKNQIGINGGVVYHVTPSLHLDLEYFRAQARWYLGEQQVVHAVSSGMTVTF